MSRRDVRRRRRFVLARPVGPVRCATPAPRAALARLQRPRSALGSFNAPPSGRLIHARDGHRGVAGGVRQFPRPNEAALFQPRPQFAAGGRRPG